MKQLQRHRELNGLLVEDLALKAGVHVRTIKELESGDKRKVQARVQRGIAKALSLRPIELFNEAGICK